jgi:ATP-dependent helicase/nuclease subunit B
VHVTFLLGPAGSGKTYRCLAEIRAALKASPEGLPLLFLAPKQATFQLERQLLGPTPCSPSPRPSTLRSAATMCDLVSSATEDGSPPGEGESAVSLGFESGTDAPVAGYTRLQILSFERLAQFVFARLGQPDPELLSEEGRVMVLRALLSRHGDELKIFRASARRPGFAQELSRLLREFQSHRLSPAQLEKQHFPQTLSFKLRDLSLLLRAYLDWLREHHLNDTDSLLDLATAALQASVAEKAALISDPAGGPPQTAGQAAAPTPHFTLSWEGLWLDGFAQMTPQEVDFLAALAPKCKQATLAFCLETTPTPEPPASWLSTWSIVSETYHRCHARLAALPGLRTSVEVLPRDPAHNRFSGSHALRHLEEFWSNPKPFPGDEMESAHHGSPGTLHASRFTLNDSMRLVTCANPEAEAVCAAREILRYVRGGGRYREASVLVRSLENYHDPLRRVFSRYEIPFFLDRREPVAHHPLAELTRFALRTIVFHWRQDDWFGALKTGLVHPREELIDWLENEALARGWEGDAWHQPFKNESGSSVVDELETVRPVLVAPFVCLGHALGAAPRGLQLAAAFRQFWRDLKAGEQLERWSQANLSTTSLHLPDTVHATVWDQMQRWLENIELAFRREPIPLREWLPIVESGLQGLTVGVIPPVLDQVLIGAVDRSRNPDLQFALVLGLNESVFPAKPAAPPLLSEADRAELERHKFHFGPDRRQQLGRERFYGYIAFTRARRRLLLTCAACDATGTVLNPSPFVAQVRKLFPQVEREIFCPDSWLESEHPSELVAWLLRGFAGQERLGSEGIENLEALLQLPRFAALRDELKNFSTSQEPPRRSPLAGGDLRRDGPALLSCAAAGGGLKGPVGAQKSGPAPPKSERLSREVVDRLYGRVLRSSVSRLEDFAACPFKFFVTSGLRAKERRLFEPDPREQGSFQHEVLAQFHRQLQAESKRWRDLSAAEARERLARVAAGVLSTFRGGLFAAAPENRFTGRVLTESLQDFVATLIEWMAHYQFDPQEVELAFGLDPQSLPAWEIDLAEGRRLVFTGKIDRVDLSRTGADEALCVVIDYKSRAQKLDATRLHHGLQLQLPAYLAYLQQLRDSKSRFGVTKLVPAGVFYVNLRGRFASAATRTEVLANVTEARQFAYLHTGRFDFAALGRLDTRGEQKGIQFNYRITKSGEPSKSCDALPTGEFEDLLARVKDHLAGMGREIFQGVVQVDPYQHGTERACDHCEFQAVCRIDPWTHPFRRLKMPAKP